MKTRNLLTLMASAVLLSSNVMAEERVFQQGADGYDGFRQAILYGGIQARRSEDLSHRDKIKVMGVPLAREKGEKAMAVIRFDDVFNPEKGGIDPDRRIVSARLELYKTGGTMQSALFDQIKERDRLIHIHQMLTPFYSSEDNNGYSCYSYRRYGGSEDEVYWGNEDRLTEGPVAAVDYREAGVGSIPIEPESGEQWYSVDVTPAVQEGKAGDGTAGHGFFLRSPHTWFGLEFASGTYAEPTLRPRLVIEFE